MRLPIHCMVALVLLLAASAQRADPPPPSGEPLSAKDVKGAEKKARTADDHLRLAAYYEYEALQKQAELKEQEDLANYWGQTPMATRTKVPNPYWNAQALVRLYREQLKKLTKLAAEHRKKAESLRTGGL
jgi:hypothetical protein